MKKITLILIIIVMLFTVAGNAFAEGDNSVIITVHNSLPFSSYKVINFSYTFKNAIPSGTKFALFDKGKQLPLQIVSIRGNTVNFKTVLNLKPSNSELLVLKYGKNIQTNYKNIFSPDFSGTKFVGIGSGNLFIVSLNENNSVKVLQNNGKTLFEGTLAKKESKIIPLPERDTVFSIVSTYPIFAEVSSLKSNCMKNSSDDVSSVFGTYFVLYIPEEIVVSSYSSTHLIIKSLSGKTIYSGTLPPRGQYKNFSLNSGFYEISSDSPVTVQFGCEDDNIYAINYGSLNSFKGVSYGNIVCSALFPDTKVQIKTVSKTYPAVTLQNRGDYVYKQVVTKFENNKTEAAPVYITYSNPVLIYSDSNHGNIGGEQIPSIYGNGKVFSFLTGKIFNFNGLIHRRKVVIIPSEQNTSIMLNGKKVLLEKALSPKIFLFSKSYTPVNIMSNKPIAVFDVGMTTSIEFLSMLIPIKDANSLSIAVEKPGESSTGKSTAGNPSVGSSRNNSWLAVLGKYLAPVSGFFVGIFNSAQKVPWIKNIFVTLKEFNASISPYLKNLSKQIIDLFMPASQMVYPYIHPYLPDLSQEQLAAIIFYILIAFIIILLIPKRRKKKVPVVKVKEEKEIKKKSQVAFNVKTIEEKGTGVKFGAPGRPKTLPPKKREAVKKQGEKAKKEAPTLPTQAPPYKRPSIRPSKTSEKPGELGKQISALYKKPGTSGAGKLKPTEKKVFEKETKEKVEKLEVVKESVKETNEKPSAIKPTAVKEEFAREEKLKGEKPEEKSIPEEKAKEVVEDKIPPTKKVSGEVEISEEKKAEEKEQKEEKPESAFAKLFKRTKSIPTEKGAISEKPENKEPEKEKVLIEKKEEEEQEETPIRTSLDELLARVKEVSEKQSFKEKTSGGLSEESAAALLSEKENKEKIEEKKESEKLGAFGIKISSSTVADKDSVNVLVEKGFIRHMSRIFVSAKDQAEIDAEIKEKYRLGVISLTPIEMRIAEDLARRIGSKRSTGEALLIAKKVGVKQILVNDSPKIREYQGIKIVNVKDITD